MKKIRITLQKNQDRWTFVLYDSVESAFYLKNEELKPNDLAYCKIITLLPQETLEVEWMGMECVYLEESAEHKTSDSMSHEKFEKVRLGKLSLNKKIDKLGGYIELYSGWLPEGTLDWTAQMSRDDIQTTLIKGRVRHKLDFDNLFKDHPDDLADTINDYPGLFSEVTGSRGKG